MISLLVSIFQLRQLRASLLGAVPEELREHVKLLLNTEPSVRPDAAQFSKVSSIFLSKLHLQQGAYNSAFTSITTEQSHTGMCSSKQKVLFREFFVCYKEFSKQNFPRLLLEKRRRDHITPLLKDLHWLPVKFRCQYKIATLAYRHFGGSLPPYLSSSLCTYEPSRSLRSSNEKLLKIPKRNFKSFGQRSSVSWHHLSGILCRPL